MLYQIVQLLPQLSYSCIIRFSCHEGCRIFGGSSCCIRCRNCCIVVVLDVFFAVLNCVFLCVRVCVCYLSSLSSLCTVNGWGS
jgi:hypothetical protein